LDTIVKLIRNFFSFYFTLIHCFAPSGMAIARFGVCFGGAWAV